MTHGFEQVAERLPPPQLLVGDDENNWVEVYIYMYIYIC
jgi:hypothetical protein